MLGWETKGDALVAPAVARNRDVILDVLRRVLPAGLIVELASGSGEHVVHFAKSLRDKTWQPSDHGPVALRSIAAHAAAADLPNLLPPVFLDAGSASWPLARADAVLSINMIHIAPWPVTESLMAGASQILPGRGTLVLHGPFKVDGRHTSESNEAFDEDLRARDPSWGVQDVEAVVEAAGERGLAVSERIEMPANNLSVVFHRRDEPHPRVN